MRKSERSTTGSALKMAAAAGLYGQLAIGASAAIDHGPIAGDIGHGQIAPGLRAAIISGIEQGQPQTDALAEIFPIDSDAVATHPPLIVAIGSCGMPQPIITLTGESASFESGINKGAFTPLAMSNIFSLSGSNGNRIAG